MFKPIEGPKHKRYSNGQLQKLVAKTVCVMVATVSSILKTMAWSVLGIIHGLRNFQLPAKTLLGAIYGAHSVKERTSFPCESISINIKATEIIIL